MKKYLFEIAKHSTIYTIANFLTRAMGILLIPIYTRYLTPSDYGIVSNVVAIINFFSILFIFGMDAVWGRFYFDFKDRSQEQKIFLGNIFLFLVSYGLAWILIIFIWGKYIFNLILPELNFWPYIVLGILTAYFGVFFRIKRMIFRVRQQSWQFGLLSFGRFLFTLTLIIIAVVFLKQGALGKIIAEFFGWLVFALICLWLIKKDITLKLDIIKLKAALKYGVSVFPHSITGVLVSVFDRILVTNFKGLSETGIYTIGLQVGSIMNLVVYSINLSWSPFFMKIVKERQDEAKKIISRLSSYYILFVCFIGLSLSFFGKEIIMVSTTKNYFRASEIVPIYVFSFVLNGIYFLFSVKIFYVKKAVKFIVLASASAALVNLLINLKLIPILGMHGAAWARFISTGVLVLITFVLSQKFFYIKYDYKFILIIVILTSFMIIFFEIFVQKLNLSFWGLFSIKILLLGVFFAIPFFVNLLKFSEFKNLIKKFRK